MGDLLRNILNPVQRQSLVISLSAFLTSLLLIVLLSLLMLIAYRGGAYFWPTPIYKVSYLNQATQTKHNVLAQLIVVDEESGTTQLKVATHESPYGRELVVDNSLIQSMELSLDSASISLLDGLTILARPLYLSTSVSDELPFASFDDMRAEVELITEEIDHIRSGPLASIHEQLALYNEKGVDEDAPAREKLIAAFKDAQQDVVRLELQRENYQLWVGFEGEQVMTVPIADIDNLYFVSDLSVLETWEVVITRMSTFLTESPKQANTAGGVFPALFGTILMVFMMTIIVTPFGVLAAIYLSEYAPDNLFTSIIRISVSNMAGVPSIVYGVFGLGFFVYTVGGNIDALFFSDTLPAPTMGTPGVFWAALTMAILTLPVVIVATEEGLRRVPDGLKQGSYALGATKLETIMKTILPIASPGIMTGVILAIARAAGEVAPLMLVGAVKFAPNLPIDGEFPFLHLDRQFMHLGVLIYDGAFHSQTNIKSASMMFASCLLLLSVVFVLNLLAVWLRTRLRKRYLQY